MVDTVRGEIIGRHADWITGLDWRIELDRIRFWQSEFGLLIGFGLKILIGCRPLLPLHTNITYTLCFIINPLRFPNTRHTECSYFSRDFSPARLEYV